MAKIQDLGKYFNEGAKRKVPVRSHLSSTPSGNDLENGY